MSLFLETIFLFFVMLIIGVVLSGGIVLLIYKTEVYNCNRLAVNLDRETEYHFWGGGCLIKVNGEFIPEDNWIINSGN